MDNFLTPVLVLIVWSLLIWCVMYARRIFYALMFYLQISGFAEGDTMAHRLAWAYVILRVLHSLVQVTVNKVMLRFGLFTISTIVLIVMALRAVADVL